MDRPLITNTVESLEERQPVTAAHDLAPLSPTELALKAELAEAKAALRSSEALFQATFDQAAVGMVHGTFTGQWLRINQRFCAIMGYTVAELSHLTFYELTHPADRDRDALAVQALVAGNLPRYITTKRYLHKDGHTIWANLTLSIVYDLQGQPAYLAAVVEDITALKQAEQQERQFAEALRNSLVALTSTLDFERVMQQILASATTVVPCEAGSIILFEGAYGRVAHLRGYPSAAATFFQDYHFSLDSLTVGAAVRHNRPYLISDTQTTPEWIPLPSTHWIRASVGVPIEQNGKVIGVLVLDSATPDHFQEADIEKLQAFAHYASLALTNAFHASQLEQHVRERTTELQTAKEQIEAILNNSLDAILLIQPDLTIRRTNAVFCTLFACEAMACTPRSLVDYLDEANVALVMRHIGRVIQTQRGCQFEVRARRHDGSVFDAEFSIGLLNADGLVLTLRDVTERKARERQLRFYASLQENVTDAVITMDIAFQIQSWNQAAATIYGWRADEAIGQNGPMLLQTRLASGAPIEITKDNLYEQGYFYGEIIEQRKDGSKLYLLSSTTLLRDEQGVPLGVVVINHDISERKQVEKALVQYAAEVEDLYNNAPCGYYSLDQEGVIVQINDTALRWLGYQRHEIVGVCNITALLTPASRALFLTNFPLFQEEGSIKDAEFELVRKDGSIIRFLLSSTAIYDEAGRYLRDRAAFYDITALKQAQDAIRESEARYRLLAENITDGIVRVNRKSECVYASPSIYHILGYTPEELLGKPMFALVHDDDKGRISAYPTDQIKPGDQVPFSIYRMRHKAGHYVWLETRSQAIYAEGATVPLGFITASRDITERKRAEDALLVKMEEERQFQSALKVLHEVSLELTTIDWLNDFYRRAIELGLERLGFERLGLLRYDARQHLAFGTYGTDVEGKVIAEPDICFDPTDYTGILQRAIENSDHIYVDEQAALYSDLQFIGYGWNAVAVLRHDNQVLGWLAADNGVAHQPLVKAQLELLALYSLSISTLLARKLAVLAMRESEEKFRRLVKAAPVAIIISNDAGEITLINDQAETLFGYTNTELLAQPVDILVPDTLRNGHTAHRNNYMLGTENGPTEVAAELLAKRKDGTLFPVEIKLSHVEIATGLLIMSFVMDISERKAAERALREQRDFLQLVIDTIPDFIAVKDSRGRFQLVNRRTAEIYGLTPTALLGKREIDIHPDQCELDRFQAQDQQALSSGQPLFIPEDAFGNDYYQINVIPLKNQAGAFDHLLVVGSNITERKHAEQVLQQALQKEKELGELKSRFVSMASHEFRTPLTSIMVLTETLNNYRHKLTDEQITQRLLKIQDQIGHLKNIMDDVLQLARIQARRMEFNPTNIDLDEVCTSILEEFQSQPLAAKRLRYTYDRSIPPLLLDKRLIRQIISNLLSNALKYSKGEQPVDLSLTYTDQGVVIQVRDEGIGIPPADRQHLFQPFHRATNVGTISGTGLGLSITKESVELHGGAITVESQVGLGTTFVVTLPTQPPLGRHGEEQQR